MDMDNGKKIFWDPNRTISVFKIFFVVVPALLFFGVAISKAWAAPQPQATIQVPDNILIGENATIEITFDNIDANDTGYGPFVDVVLPVNGADGAAGTQEPDGVDIGGDATFLGMPVTTVVQTFPDDGAGSGCVEHPFAVDASGDPIQVCGTTGDKLVSVQLPFGSFVPDQPPAVIDLPIKVSPKADLDTSLDVRARAGFQFGATPQDDPSIDPPILSDNDTSSDAWVQAASLSPALLRLEKVYSGSETETATGPNFPRRYRINVRIAPGQTISNLDIIDNLPSNMAFTQLIDVSPGSYSVVSSPHSNIASNPPDNRLDVRISSVTADADPDSVDAYCEFEYFIPLNDADSARVIDPDTGDDVLSENQASALGDWTPVDSRDPGGQDNAVADAAGPEHILNDRSIAVQKSTLISTDTGAQGFSPGDTVEYTLSFQVSDYFSFDDVRLADVISDGQDFDTSFTPVLEINMDGNSSSAEFDTSNYTHDVNADGTETLSFDVSAELNRRFGDSRFTGGCIPDSGTGAGNAPDCSSYNHGPTTGRIIFRAVIKEEFDQDFPSGDQSVDQGDELNDNVTVSGNVLSVEDNSSPTGYDEADTSHDSFNIENGNVSKAIYAINGNTTLPDPLKIRPGDTVTYRLVFSMPTNDVEDLALKDYLPLPVFDATEIGTFDDTANDSCPAAGHAKFGPSDTFHQLYDDGSGNDFPAIDTSSSENSVAFNYGNFDSNDTDPTTIDILFTVTVKDDPFADGMFLTNMVRAHNGSTNAESVYSDGIVQIELAEPALEITKGVYESDNPEANATITPSPGQLPVDGDISQSDGGDTITFIITVENRGGAPAYDVTISDDTDVDMEDCTLDTVKNGNGDDLGYSGDLFGSGLVLDHALEENDGSPGAPYGADTALVTFHCKVKADTQPTDSIDRTATTQWAAQSGSEKFPEKKDDATVSMALPDMSKAVSSVSPGPIAPNMTIGDIVTYRMDITLPEGICPGVSLVDTLPAGLQYVSDSLDVNTDDFEGSFSQSPDVTVSGQTITIDLGDANVTADNDSSNNSLYVTFQAQVMDDTANSATTSLQAKQNSVELTFTGYSGTPITGTATNYLGEPFLEVTKTITPSEADAGDQITIDLTVQNTGTSPAFDITVTDDLDGNVFDLGNVTEGTTDSNFTFDYSSPTVSYTSQSGFGLNPGNSASFSFITFVIEDIVTGSPYLNTATTSYSSESGSVSGERGGSANGTETINISRVSLGKQIFDTSESATADSRVAIGEVVTFDITFTMPEGITKQATLEDVLLKVSGTNWGEYVAGSAQIMKTSSALSCSGSICTDALNGASEGDWVSADSYITINDAASNTGIRLDIGDANNTDTDNNSLESYVLRLKVLVLNNAVTNAGTTLPDRGALIYEDAAGNRNIVISRPQDLLAAEPMPHIQKGVSPSTASGGDTITFSLDICNNASGDSAAPAFDWAFTDPLPDKYENPSLQEIDTGSTGANVSASFSGGTLSGTIDRLDPGECISVIYTAQLTTSVQYGEEITNTASFTTTSLPGDHGTGDATPGDPGAGNGERNGSGNVNDLAGSSSAQVTISEPSLSKRIIDYQDWYAVGEKVNFEITAGMPSGTSNSLVITDQLPSGLSFVAGSLIVDMPQDASAGNSPLSEQNGSFFSYDSSTGLIRLDFGNVTIQDSGDIIVRYQAEIENIGTNQDGQVLTNQATLNYEDPDNPGQMLSVGPVVSTRQVHVGEPDLEMAKQITAGATGSDAGDTISYRVSIQNTGHTTAYQVAWTDVLPNGLYNISNGHVVVDGSVFLNGTTNQPSDSDISITTTVNTHDTIALPGLEIGPGASLSVEFDAVVMDTVTPGQTLNNLTRASYTSLVDGGRDNSSNPGAVDDDDDGQLNNYEESAGQALIVASDVAIDKQADRSRLAIGDTVRFTIRADIIEGTTSSLVMHDVLPDGLAYVSHSVHVGNSGISFSNPDYNDNQGAGQEVVLEFGDVTNPSDDTTTDDYIEVEIVARAENTSANQSGVILRNGEQADGSEVYLTYGTGGDLERVDFDNDLSTPGIQGIPIELIEPDLEVSKAVSPQAQSLGDLVTYTITIRHTSDSNADAYDLVVHDTLPQGLSYVDSSLPPSDVSVNGHDLEFRINSLSLSEGQKNLTYRARIDLDAPVDQALQNILDLTWKSLSGATGQVDSGRTGSDCPQGLNDYCDSASASVTPTSSALIDAEKTVMLVDDRDGSGSVTSGDVLRYTIILANGSTPVTGVVFHDPIPSNTVYVPGTITVDNIPMTDAADNDSSDFNESVDNTVTVSVGPMSEDQRLTISFQVRVDDSTPAGVIISNQGVVDSDQSVPEPTDADGIDGNGDQPTDISVGASAGPGLRAEKAVALTNDVIDPTDGTINVGDEVTYTIRLINTGGQELENVDFIDDIPTGVEISSVSNANWTQPSNRVTAHFDSIPVGEVQIITITATVQSTGLVTNQGMVTADQVPETLTDGNTDPMDGAQPTVFQVVGQGSEGSPDLVLTKQIQLTGDTNNDGFLNPGESFRYALVFSNRGSASATGVRLSDPVPEHLSVIPGSVHTSQGAVVSESPVDINLGTLAAGESATISFEATVDPATAPGTQISNQATGSEDGGTTVFSDDPGVDDGRDCSASASNCGDGDTGNDDPTDITVSGAHVFDPPSVVKIGTYEGNAVVSWRQVWINDGNIDANRVRIIDPIPSGTTYIDGSLSCVATGSSSTQRCLYDVANNQVVWEGVIGADQGASNEEDAQNEVVIVFQTRFNNNIMSAQNQTRGYWDADGDGFIEDDITAGQVAITSAAAVRIPVNVPTFDAFGAIILVFLLALAVCTKTRGVF